MTDVNHPVLASKKVIRDKYLFACPTLECRVSTFTSAFSDDTTADRMGLCPACTQPGIKLRDPLPEHITRLHQPLNKVAVENA